MTTTSATTTCADCSANLDETPAGRPCPSCGGERRGVNIQVVAADGFAFMGMTASVSIGHNKQGAWQQKWIDVEWQLAELRQLYGVDSTGNVALRIQIENVLKTCRELADWLWEHPNETRLTEDQLLTFVRTHPELSICDGFAQTSKHNIRVSKSKNPPDLITAWVERVDSSGVASIKWESQSGAVTGQRDALELCEVCADAWLKFLKGEGLLPADHKPIRT
ncbi:hypothetical protein [Nakamurella multipartita]|uniref:Uncharacterized protein n=1 Tax=Nakamurella multipartita (strain ATCC 700099 / DSM 44233 / CIP 104796 / JCM 9543 / NBRC 105858 / Y-104) TaxID=479431 RepID=C8XF29_NAKMY|nr:hypothetical protein [Nakamurella multipartita]ACV77915.1 hypothetical protein Namu_1516 [Nakamurella multipartita DSM 44233]